MNITEPAPEWLAVGGVHSTVDQDAVRCARVAVLDPEAVAVSRGQHVNVQHSISPPA